MMGWRVGYAAFPPSLMPELFKVQDTIAICPSIARRRSAARRRRPWLGGRHGEWTGGTEAHRVDAPRRSRAGGADAVKGGSGAIYLFCRLPTGCRTVAPASRRGHGVCLIRDGVRLAGARAQKHANHCSRRRARPRRHGRPRAARRGDRRLTATCGSSRPRARRAAAAAAVGPVAPSDRGRHEEQAACDERLSVSRCRRGGDTVLYSTAARRRHVVFTFTVLCKSNISTTTETPNPRLAARRYRVVSVRLALLASRVGAMREILCPSPLTICICSRFVSHA